MEMAAIVSLNDDWVSLGHGQTTDGKRWPLFFNFMVTK